MTSLIPARIARIHTSALPLLHLDTPKYMQAGKFQSETGEKKVTRRKMRTCLRNTGDSDAAGAPTVRAAKFL